MTFSHVRSSISNTDLHPSVRPIARTLDGISFSCVSISDQKKKNENKNNKSALNRFKVLLDDVATKRYATKAYTTYSDVVRKRAKQNKKNDEMKLREQMCLIRMDILLYSIRHNFWAFCTKKETKTKNVKTNRFSRCYTMRSENVGTARSSNSNSSSFFASLFIVTFSSFYISI